MADGKAGGPPVSGRELCQLTSHGVDKEHIKFKNVSLQSNLYVTVREEGKNSVAIIDVNAKTAMRLPVPVDSAIMNPVSKVVALRAGNNLQIFSLEMKTMMKKTQVANQVLYWKWLDLKTVAIVTDKEVLHWSMDGSAEPQKMFDRAATQSAVQVINYRSSADNKWLMLGGIAAGAAPGQIQGVLQVHSVDLNTSQPTMDAHAACFSSVKIDGRESAANLFAFTSKAGDGAFKLTVLEIGVPREQAFSIQTNVQLGEKDFPVSLIPDNRHGSLFLLSKDGYLCLFEIQSGKCIYQKQASAATMFASCEHLDGGVVAVDQSGRVSHFAIDRKAIVPYIVQQMQDLDLGIAMAKRYDLEGAGQYFKQQFDRLMQTQRYQEAMELAASSPQGILRTVETINALKVVANGAGVLQYFQLLLKKGSLNKIESIELAKPVIQGGRAAGIEKIKDLIKENKLEPSEDLGDLLRSHNIQLALSVYLRAKVPEKVISCFLTLAAQEPNDAEAIAHLNNILEYSKRVQFQPELPLLIAQLIRVNSDRAKDLALLLIKHPDGPKIDIETLVNTFMVANDVKNTTNILLEYLKPRGNREEDAALQTKLLEINLLTTPQVAEAIMDHDEYKFTHYDRLKIAQLCERAQLYQKALEHYTELSDIKRVLSNTHLLNPDFLLEYFGRMTPENCLDCLRDLLKYNLQQNIRLVVEVAKKWNDYLTPKALIQLFEEFKSFNGIYFYLGSFVNQTADAKVVFKYIEAATKLNQVKEVERVCRDNEKYDPKEVKEFLIQQNLKDPRPLIHVCDKWGFVPELTQHLYNNQMYLFIEAYVTRMNAKATPQVVGTLLELNAPEENIKKLLAAVRPPGDDKQFVERLVAEVEKRNRLVILRPWLEARAGENSEDPAVHNGLAKIYVDKNISPQQFLVSNKFYDSKIVGAYCESRDPHLAFIAYKRAQGSCDKELIAVTNKNGFFKDQARYLVERQNLDLWASVLAEQNEHRRQLIDQVVATALPESRVPEEVSNTVKAFMAANLPNELIELLERIILHGPSDGEFHSNKNLQNLLILTAIKADPKRVMDYIKRLENYDGPDIAKIAVSDQYKLYEEAFFIYKKFGKFEESIQVLLDNLEDMGRAVEFANYANQPPVWSLLAKAQLDLNMVKEAIQCFLKADDASVFDDVIAAAKQENLFAELIPFLVMARNKIKDSPVDNELIYAYAKTNKLAEMEEFISSPNCKAKFQDVGDQLFDEKLFQSAKILFNHINNFAKLAICLVRLQQFQDAVDAARKANAIATWKEVCFACVDAGHFRLAQMCGVNIIVYNEHLLDLCKHYETSAHFEELMQLLEQGIVLDRVHQGIYTQLGVCYCKYKEEKVQEHIKMFWQKLNIPTLLRECQKNQLWQECVFLYTQYDQFDNAIDVMIDHSPQAWDHKRFKEILNQVPNHEYYYRAIDFYLAEHPLLLNDLLGELKLDHSRVVNKLKAHLPLVEKYLLAVQRDNLHAVNDAVNELFLAEEKYKQLRESIVAYDKFDQIALAQKLEGHELLEFRRISAYVYKLNKRYEKSIDLSKADSLWADAMETAAESKNQELAESLLEFFVKRGERECFAACLFTCYELIRPDVVLELSWRNGLNDFAMPYVIQSFRHYNDRLLSLSAKFDEFERERREAEAKAKREGGAAETAPNPMQIMPLPLALPPPLPVAGGYGGAPQMPMLNGGTNPYGQPAGFGGGLPPLPPQGGGNIYL